MHDWKARVNLEAANLSSKGNSRRYTALPVEHSQLAEFFSTVCVSAFTGLVFGSLTDMSTFAYVLYYTLMLLILQIWFENYQRVNILSGKGLQLTTVSAAASLLLFHLGRRMLHPT